MSNITQTLITMKHLDTHAHHHLNLHASPPCPPLLSPLQPSPNLHPPPSPFSPPPPSPRPPQVNCVARAAAAAAQPAHCNHDGDDGNSHAPGWRPTRCTQHTPLFIEINAISPPRPRVSLASMRVHCKHACACLAGCMLWHIMCLFCWFVGALYFVHFVQFVES
jgi:hypothetical protein